CLLCGGDDAEPIIEAADPLGCTGPQLRYRVVRCAACSLTYTNPRPTVNAIGHFYPEDYAPYEQRSSDRSLQSWARRQDPFTRALPLVPGGRLLDFGCGAGEMLQQMSAHGWN